MLRRYIRHSESGITHKEWSRRIHNCIKRETSRTPWKLKCILIYNAFFNKVLFKVLRLVIDDLADTDWAEIVGSYAEKTCVSSSDVDFIQIRGEVFARAEDVPARIRLAYLVYTEDDRIPPGSCWIRIYDTTRCDIPRSTNGIEYYLYDEDKQIPERCLSRQVHVHETEKVPCFAAAHKQRTDGNFYYSRLVFADYLAAQGLTQFKKLDSILPKWCAHGPAFTQTYFGLFNIDVVYSFRCESSWPKSAKEWVSRERQDWPSKEMVQTIVNSGFDVVPIPSKLTHGCDAEFEWRISFRTAETKLVLSLNECQRDCFIALKVFVKQYVEPEFPDEDFLSSYIMKTVMFWTIEKTGIELWERQNTVHCLSLCLKQLQEWIEDGFCPSYFIPAYNLFRTKLNRMFVLGFRTWLVTNIWKYDWKVILHCKAFKGM